MTRGQFRLGARATINVALLTTHRDTTQVQEVIYCAVNFPLTSRILPFAAESSRDIPVPKGECHQYELFNRKAVFQANSTIVDSHQWKP